MVGVCFVFVLDAEVVDNECESDGVGGMSEKARDIWSFMVACGGQVSDESFLSEETCLWQAIHALRDFRKYFVVVNEGVQAVFHHDGVGNHFDWNADVLGAGKGRHQVVVFDVRCHPIGVVGDD